MLKYLQFGQKGGHEIITYIGVAPSDPEETKKKVTPMLLETDEYKKLNKMGKKKHSLQVTLIEALRTKNNRLYIDTQEKLAALEKRLIEADKIFLKKRRAMFEEHMVCSTPGNARLIDDKETRDVADKFANTKATDFIDSSGKFISGEQMELDIISLLTDEQRFRRKEYDIGNAMSEIRIYREELEISGESTKDALKKAQNVFSQLKSDIEKKYNCAKIDERGEDGK